MLAGDKPAFETILRELFGAIDKPLSESTVEGFWKGLARMTLLEFSRTRDLLMDDFSKGEAPRKFGVPDIWAAKKRLRAPAPPPATDNWQGDDWDRRANLRMLSYVLRAAYERRKLSEAETRAVVAYKNRWADIMRDCGTPEDVPLADQADVWKSCMAEAEAAMAMDQAA